MRVTVEFDDAERTRGTLTIWPSWIGRLFGRLPRATRIERGYCSWRYKIDGHILSSALASLERQQARWPRRVLRDRGLQAPPQGVLAIVDDHLRCRRRGDRRDARGGAIVDLSDQEHASECYGQEFTGVTS